MTAGLTRLRVLVVEDEPLIGMVIEEAVEGLGHDVEGPVAELDLALDLATRVPLDCAILDINIRGGQSYPVSFALLDRGLPILLLTGYEEHTLPKRLRGQRRLPKPFTGEQLDEELRRLFARVIDCGHEVPVEQDEGD